MLINAHHKWANLIGRFYAQILNLKGVVLILVFSLSTTTVPTRTLCMLINAHHKWANLIGRFYAQILNLKSVVLILLYFHFRPLLSPRVHYLLLNLCECFLKMYSTI